MTQEEKYIDALNKLRDAKEAFDQLTDENKERFAQEVLGFTALNDILKYPNNNR